MKQSTIDFLNEDYVEETEPLIGKETADFLCEVWGNPNDLPDPEDVKYFNNLSNPNNGVSSCN